MGWYEEMVERFAVVRDEAIREADAMASPFGESRASRTLQASGVDLAAIRHVAPLSDRSATPGGAGDLKCACGSQKSGQV
jgi:hypothetical protein